THPFRCKGIEVATLREVFEKFPRARMNIEIKQPSPALVARFCRMLRDHAMTDKVLVASFDDDVLADFRRQCPEVATSTSRGELINFLLRSAFTSRPPSADVDAVQTSVATLVGPLGRRFVERARRFRLPVHAWTVNRRRHMEQMIELGVDGIITDEPGLLLTVLGRA
ncbi:MAG TPA: glycerophosphodiester phosphodiesterase family protein, partial [Pyrinomonadaceae bacterium]|nr:glycerophosphodiester phosphodiesterase family protein [Pyrinomonadaceae bacterium]